MVYNFTVCMSVQNNDRMSNDKRWAAIKVYKMGSDVIKMVNTIQLGSELSEQHDAFTKTRSKIGPPWRLNYKNDKFLKLKMADACRVKNRYITTLCLQKRPNFETV